jgi:tetratricopeptide (TPR) repeat protein
MTVRRPGFFFLLMLFVLAGAREAETREPVKPTSGNAKTQAWVDKAWAALDEEVTLLTIDEAIGCLEKAVALDPANAEILVELADEYYQRGEQMRRDGKQDFDARAAYFVKGRETAERALALRETAGAHYWVAVNLAASFENRSSLRQVTIFPRLDEHMDWIQTNDRSYKYGAISRFWSRVVTRVPGVVVRMVGEDPNRIFEALDEAIRIEPRFVDNYLYKAEFLHHMGRQDDALRVLDQALRMDPEAFPSERAYNRYAQRKAIVYWKEWTGKEYPER